MIRQGLAKLFTPPPMPDGAMPGGVFGRPAAVQQTMQVAWEAMFYHTLTTGIIFGALAMLALLIGPMVRRNLAATAASHFKGLADAE